LKAVSKTGEIQRLHLSSVSLQMPKIGEAMQYCQQQTFRKYEASLSKL